MNIEALLHIRRVIAEWAETNPIIERARVFHQDWDVYRCSIDSLVFVVDVVVVVAQARGKVPFSS